ncbi:MAG: AI-2E family transporter [Patescibacteria group bacterium]|jgi:predicted PurR-regulated permease PerM
MLQFKTIQSTIFIIILTGVLIGFMFLVAPYSYSIFWAAVIAVLTQPIYKWLLNKFNQRARLATAITMLIVVLVCLIPLSLVITLAIQQTLTLYSSLNFSSGLGIINDWITQALAIPGVSKIIGEVDMKQKALEWSATVSSYAYSLLASGSQNTVRLLIQLFIMLYTLYFFIKDGAGMLKKAMYLLPLGDHYEQRLYDRFTSTTRATLKGTVLIGIIQGVIGGLVFFITGIPGAAFWGMIMIVVSIIPSVGAGTVLFIGSVLAFFQGNLTAAIILLVGTVIAGLIDNVLRGPLVGKDTQMHPLLIFFSTLGGLTVFGVSGIVIGPVITALLISLLEIYQHIYKPELDKAD